jgi:hypothetical protein
MMVVWREMMQNSATGTSSSGQRAEPGRRSQPKFAPGISGMRNPFR